MQTWSVHECVPCKKQANCPRAWYVQFLPCRIPITAVSGGREIRGPDTRLVGAGQNGLIGRESGMVIVPVLLMPLILLVLVSWGGEGYVAMDVLACKIF